VSKFINNSFIDITIDELHTILINSISFKLHIMLHVNKTIVTDCNDIFHIKSIKKIFFVFY